MTISPTTPKPEQSLAAFLQADTRALETISRERSLSLSVEEMSAIQNHFKALGRSPTDLELETLAQTWSEHCKHKTFKGRIEYVSQAENDVCPSRTYENLLSETIMKATEELSLPWCLSVFKDNAGIISFDEELGVAFKVETHNHPSALEPYGGAGTGIGGVIRDILGVGLGAWPIANTDVFCFGPMDTPKDKMLSGTLSPWRIFKGVVSGVRDYGNRMGIPTLNGAICFDEGFLYNPLVYCGCVGLIPRSKIAKDVKPGDLVVSVGGRTGRDGIHGATFSSAELTGNIPSSVVQIGNPIVQKKFADVLIKARDLGLYRAVTDCGAGGFSSAVGELGAGYNTAYEDAGVRVYLEKAPLKYQGLLPWEIWLSESQERMVLAVPPEHEQTLRELFAKEDVEATVIGEFTDSKALEVLYRGQHVGKLSMEFLHQGCPQVRLGAQAKTVSSVPLAFEAPENLAEALKKILALPTVASKEWVIRQYDHEVQARTVMKPLVGRWKDGPGDAAVLHVAPSGTRGIALSAGINPQYGKLDTYWMAASVLEEAIRNVVSVGADPGRIALLDNFCWGDPKKPECLGDLVRAAQACADFAKAFGTPFVSGKDSLNNEYLDPKSGQRISIPPTLLISAVGLVEDIRKTVSSDAKNSGDLLYIAGQTKDELGGSAYALSLGASGGKVPRVDAASSREIFQKVHRAISDGMVRACHDCSEGGLAAAASEMAFSGNLGLTLELKGVPLAQELETEKRLDKILFSESNSRFLLEIPPDKKEAFEKLMEGSHWGLIGEFNRSGNLVVLNHEGQQVVHVPCEELRAAWQSFSKHLEASA